MAVLGPVTDVETRKQWATLLKNTSKVISNCYFRREYDLPEFFLDQEALRSHRTSHMMAELLFFYNVLW
jgi:hypothetical protein